MGQLGQRLVHYIRIDTNVLFEENTKISVAHEKLRGYRAATADIRSKNHRVLRGSVRSRVPDNMCGPFACSFQFLYELLSDNSPYAVP